MYELNLLPCPAGWMFVGHVPGALTGFFKTRALALEAAASVGAVVYNA